MFRNKSEFKNDFAARIVSKYGRSIEQAHMTEYYMVLGEMVRDYASVNWKSTKERVASIREKEMWYFSMEFLIGRLLTNNLMNFGIYEIVRDGLADLGIDINKLEELESDAGLGNGGLGRLAACFLDSLATLNLPGNGNCIRYEYGFFKQTIVNGKQVEVPDQWLRLGNVWEVRKPKHAVEVPFWGRIEYATDENGNNVFKHVDAVYVKAVPYDMPVVGRGTRVTNTLRLWRPEASENLPKNKDFSEYISDVNEICQNLYPDDSTEHGKYLRLKQQYFFVAAGLKAIIKKHLRVYPTLDNFHEKHTIQLNDTHPVLVIPELMRVLMDEYKYSWEDAMHITSNCVNYTNHTVLSEALEKWPVAYIQKLLPRIYMIIDEINRRFVEDIRKNPNFNEDRINRVKIIKDGLVHMASLAIVCSKHVNGVARLHTEILVNDVMKDFYELFPERFSNKTNGVTPRRWLVYSNPQLRQLLEDTIGSDFIENAENLIDLMDHVDDKRIQNKFIDVKLERKQILAKYIKDTLNIDVDPTSIFDIQVKRLHAYKRQLLNVMHIIYLYQRMKEDSSFRPFPRTFIFGAKAAPSYFFAKKVIELINNLSDVINNDPEVNEYLKVIFIPNYGVTIAEKIMNAADVSEQISTAGKEASGTGNMKFMMNGALTLGTLDGANVEISERVGAENCMIFGLKDHEVAKLKNSGTYNPWDYYNSDPRIKKVLDSIKDNTWGKYNVDRYRTIFEELMYHGDEYMLLADFDSYVKAQEEVEKRYLDRLNWARMCLINIAQSGYFSSDRTIREYAEEIWDIHPLKL